MATTPPSSAAVPQFHRLSPSVLSYSPPPGTPSDPSDPSTILLFGWMDAPARALAKYTLTYTHLFPSSRILLVTSSSGDFIYRTFARQFQNLSPALSKVRSDEKKSLLLHSFSNGGAQHVVNLAMMYKKATGKLLPIKALVIDSAPGPGEYMRAIRCLVTAYKTLVWWRRWIAVAGTYAVFMLLGEIWRLMGWRNRVVRIREELNNEKLIMKEGRRVYIYGDGDEVIPVRDVEEHIQEARKKGFLVRGERFDGTAHVQHVRGEEERYWGVVTEAWREERDEGYMTGESEKR
jgi:hypothetical protein